MLHRGHFRGTPLGTLVLADRFVRRADPMVADRRVQIVDPATASSRSRKPPAGPGRAGSPDRIPVNLPALTVSVAQLLDTLCTVAGDAVADLVTVAPDAGIEALVGSWPAEFDATRAHGLGLRADPDAGSVIHQYLADHGPTGTAPTGSVPTGPVPTRR